MKFGCYSIKIAQNDDESKKLNFGVCPNSTISLYFSRSDMPDMRCFSIGGMKNQHDAILESLGTTEEIIFFTHSITVNNLLSFSIFSPSP